MRALAPRSKAGTAGSPRRSYAGGARSARPDAAALPAIPNVAEHLEGRTIKTFIQKSPGVSSHRQRARRVIATSQATT
jgi:hypothetical protein